MAKSDIAHTPDTLTLVGNIYSSTFLRAGTTRTMMMSSSGLMEDLEGARLLGCSWSSVRVVTSELSRFF